MSRSEVLVALTVDGLRKLYNDLRESPDPSVMLRIGGTLPGYSGLDHHHPPRVMVWLSRKQVRKLDARRGFDAELIEARYNGTKK